MAALELILVLLAAVALLALLAEKLEIPLPALLVLGGIGLALAPGLPRPSLDPDVVFLIFVPPLLYWTALNTSWRDFRQNLRSISLLAVGLVIVTMIAVACGGARGGAGAPVGIRPRRSARSFRRPIPWP